MQITLQIKMGITGIWQWLVVGLIVVLLFARPGKISRLNWLEKRILLKILRKVTFQMTIIVR